MDPTRPASRARRRARASGGPAPEANGTCFAGYPSVVIYKSPRARGVANAVDHLLWGDWMRRTGKEDGDWVQVKARGRMRQGWVPKASLIESRLLEVNFVDIGQGDGSLIVTPEDKWILVDAGERDNMFRFLRWRFGKFQQKVAFECFVITHGDKDHYLGFKRLLRDPNVQVGTIYHNGVVDRPGKPKLGPSVKVGGVECLDDVIATEKALRALFPASGRLGFYPALMKQALDSGRVGTIRMLSSRDRHLPGYENGPLRIEVLAPVPEAGRAGKLRLRRFGASDGVTKNGHSIVLRLRYGNVAILLGGDLNTPAENHLLAHYGRFNPSSAGPAALAKGIAQARKALEADVAKACHHGSHDFTSEFLRAVNPIATVVSSGDAESYAHPRPDALGTFGLCSRGPRPLIFSTELARSSREAIDHPFELKRSLSRYLDGLVQAADGPARHALVKEVRDLLKDKLDRSVEVYGMITLRTDGQKVVLAQRLEKTRSKASKWDIHRLEPDAQGRLVYVIK